MLKLILASLLILFVIIHKTACMETELYDDFGTQEEVMANELRELEKQKRCLRGPDGKCVNRWRDDREETLNHKSEETKELLFKRQSSCNRKQVPLCKLTIGRKRDTRPIIRRDDPGDRARSKCERAVGRMRFLCRKLIGSARSAGSLGSPRKFCDERSGKCSFIDNSKRNTIPTGKKYNFNRQYDTCNPNSPFCYLPYPGKRADSRENDARKFHIPSVSKQEDTVTVTNTGSGPISVTHLGLVPDVVIQEWSKQEEPMNTNHSPARRRKSGKKVPKPFKNCDPRKDYFCRFRITGRRRDEDKQGPRDSE